jgi:hypothetical protein
MVYVARERPAGAHVYAADEMEGLTTLP